LPKFKNENTFTKRFPGLNYLPATIPDVAGLGIKIQVLYYTSLAKITDLPLERGTDIGGVMVAMVRSHYRTLSTITYH